MNKKLLFVSVITLLSIPTFSQAAIKCWTNKEGVRECGNVVPPEYAQQSSETINERGITVETQKRALTKEELAKINARKEEERRRAEEEAARQKKQAAVDRVLLATFLSEEEIIAARDRQLAAIEANIEITNITIDKMSEDLQAQRKKAANYERRGKTVPEGTLKEIASLERQIASKQEFIQNKASEKGTIREKYAKDLERFRELKAQGKKLR